MGDGNEVWSGVVLTPDEQAALDERRLERVYAQIGRRLARIPKGATITHLDGDVRNNDPANLRVVDPRDRGEQ